MSVSLVTDAVQQVLTASLLVISPQDAQLDLGIRHFSSYLGHGSQYSVSRPVRVLSDMWAL